MEKTIIIDDKEVRLKAHGGTTLIYKMQFKRDFFADVLKLNKLIVPYSKIIKNGEMDLSSLSEEELESFDLEPIRNFIWVFAKAADPQVPDPITWYSGFSYDTTFDLFFEVQDMISSVLMKSKKKP